MSTRLVVFDFDGTLTDIAAEGAAFEAAYAAAVGGLFGEARLEVYRECLAAVRAQAPELGWNMGGGVTAPGDADPYISASLAFARFCTELKLPLLGGADARSAALRGELSGQLYSHAYGSLQPAFRADAGAVLAEAQRRELAHHLVGGGVGDDAHVRRAASASAGSATRGRCRASSAKCCRAVAATST